jgi:O-antigen biosynthesis protein
MDDQSAATTDDTPMTANDETERYRQQIDVDSDSTHARVVQLVGSDRRVLELGPATGHMTQVFAQRGCTVVGIEIDPEMAPEAERFAERVIVGDLDSLDLDAELGDDRFDVIVAADVLEHLRDPLSVLRRLRAFLSPGGYFVLSLPNVAHGSVRLALLQGHFDYRDIGLLDRTHLRFFTRQNIAEMLDEAELAITTLYRQMLPVANSEISFDDDAVPPEIRERLDHDPEAETYQFVLKAIPLETEGLREVQRRIRDMADEIAQLRERTGEKALEEQLAASRADAEASRAQSRELRGALITAHDQMLRRDEEIQRMQGELASREDEVEVLIDQIRRLRVRLDRILNSPPARVYSALGTMPGVRGLKQARTAGYRKAVKTDQRTDG